MHFRELLVPVDFEGPIEPKLALARDVLTADGEVTILHAGRDAHARDVMQSAARKTLKDIPVRYDLVEGDLARAIIEAARRADTDLIVLFPHTPIGTATQKVLLEVDCDVLCFPARSAALEQSSLDIRSIICGVDFSANDLLVVPRAAEVARDSSAELTLVHVTPSVDRYGPGGVHGVPELRDAFLSAATKRMHEVLRDTRVNARTLVLSASDAIRGLNDAIARTRADLVVIGRHPCAGFPGGNCLQIATEATAPVLAIRT